MAISSLPDDVLSYEILSGLPVNYLTQFKAVSKTWRSVISSSLFVKSFLDRRKTNAGDDKTFVVQLRGKETEVRETHSYALFHLGSGQIVADLESPYSRYPVYNLELNEAVLVGSDCGIVCLLVSVDVDDCYSDTDNWLNIDYRMYRTDIYLWNPATKHVNLISAQNDHDETCSEAVGFGFDCMTLDFKVVRIVCHSTQGTVDYIGVYSANRNSWRKIEANYVNVNDFYYRRNVYHDVCLFDVCLHGFLLCTGYSGMIAFDLHKEVFYCEIELPDIDDCEAFETTVTDFNDSIAVFTSKNTGCNDKFKLWTLDDEDCLRGGEVKTSWTMMLSIDLGQPVQSVVGYFNHGDLLLVSKDNALLSYNIDKKEVREVQACFHYHRVFKYTESLISVEGSVPIDWTDSEDDD